MAGRLGRIGEEAMKYLISSTVVALTLCHAYSARADEVTLVAPGGIRAAIVRMIPDFERKTGHKVKATFGSGDRPVASSRTAVACPAAAG